MLPATLAPCPRFPSPSLSHTRIHTHSLSPAILSSTFPPRKSILSFSRLSRYHRERPLLPVRLVTSLHFRRSPTVVRRIRVDDRLVPGTDFLDTLPNEETRKTRRRSENFSSFLSRVNVRTESTARGYRSEKKIRRAIYLRSNRRGIRSRGAARSSSSKNSIYSRRSRAEKFRDGADRREGESARGGTKLRGRDGGRGRGEEPRRLRVYIPAPLLWRGGVSGAQLLAPLVVRSDCNSRKSRESSAAALIRRRGVGPSDGRRA